MQGWVTSEDTLFSSKQHAHLMGYLILSDLSYHYGITWKTHFKKSQAMQNIKQDAIFCSLFLIYVDIKGWVNTVSQLKMVKPSLGLFTVFCFCAHV